MKDLKISFLMAVHNEEKIIAKALDNLLKLPYKNYEVIIGLDGCTDRSEEIVKGFAEKSKNFKYCRLNLRQGKAAVVDRIIKKASGEIIIVNDADWIFETDKKHMEKFISIFKDEKAGGIAESFPVEWDREKIKKGNLGYRMVAYSSYLWLEFQKEKFTYREKGIIYLKEPTMFLTNIFRKKLYNKNLSLGDDFERTKDIMDKGYKIVIFEDIKMPRMTAVYDKLSVKDLFRQKKRTAIARRQLKDYKVAEISLKNYYIPATYYILKNSWKMGFSTGITTLFWVFLTSIAAFSSVFNKKSTKEGWKLRMRR